MIFAELTTNNLVKNIVVADDKPDENYVEVEAETLVDIAFIYDEVTGEFTDPRIPDESFYLDKQIEARSFYAEHMRTVYNIDVTFVTPEGTSIPTTATVDELAVLVGEATI